MVTLYFHSYSPVCISLGCDEGFLQKNFCSSDALGLLVLRPQLHYNTRADEIISE